MNYKFNKKYANCKVFTKIFEKKYVSLNFVKLFRSYKFIPIEISLLPILSVSQSIRKFSGSLTS